MKYGKGTISFATRTIFADNGEYDNKFGHPAMLPIAIDDTSDEVYYLLLTSNISRIITHPDDYYDLSDYWKEIGLKKPSLINLQNVYKGEITGKKLGGLIPSLYKDVIKELKEYQASRPCDNYKEIEHLL